MIPITTDALMSEAQRLYAYAYQRLGDHQHAQDAVQETLVTAWQKRETFDARSSLAAWLGGILKFKVLDHFRAAKRVPTQLTRDHAPLEESWGADPFDSLFNAHGSWKIDPNYGLKLLDDSPAETAQRSEVLAWVRHCVKRLPERLRLLFTLRELDNLPVAEAASAAGVTPGSAAVLLTRARYLLRICLQHHDVTP